MRSQRTFFLTPMRLATHRFARLARASESMGMSKVELLRGISAGREKNMKAGSSLLATATALFLATPAGNELTAFQFSTPYFSFSIPKIFLVFFNSVTLGFGMLAIISDYVLMRYATTLKMMHFKGIDSDVIDAILDPNSAYANPPNFAFRFLKSQGGFGVLMFAPLFATLLPIILLAAHIIWALISFSWETIGRSNSSWRDTVIAATAISTVTFPVLYGIAIHIPMPLRANTSYIRWNFLFPLHRKRFDRIHPQASHWVEQARKFGR